MKIPVAKIITGSNYRTVFDPVKLEELAASIDANGLAQHIVVRPVGQRFELVAGERRLRAVTMLGWRDIDADVRELDDEQMAAFMLTENASRVDPDMIDEAAGYQSAMDRFGWSAGEVAQRAGVSVARVATRLPLLKLIPKAQHLVRIGQLSINHSKVMAPLDANRQHLALAALARGVQYFAFRDYCSQLLTEQEAEPMFDPDAFLRMEDDLGDHEQARRKPSPTKLIAALLDALEGFGHDDATMVEARQFLGRQTC